VFNEQIDDICWNPAPTCAPFNCLLGHRSLATTARYSRVATSKVCSTTSPLDRSICSRSPLHHSTSSCGTWIARKFEVADLFRRYGEAYRHEHGASLSTAQPRGMTAIEVYRTAVLGGHLEQCDHCGHQRNA
jgi:hypothetical protein